MALILNSGLRCTRGSFIPDGAEPSDDLVFPIAIAKSVGQSAGSELLAQYVSELQKEIGVSVNEALWSNVTGANAE